MSRSVRPLQIAMDRDIITERFSIDPESPYLEDWAKYVWYCSELCNNCFTRVRDVGPEVARPMESQTTYINLWYERTEEGSQEHSKGDHNKRFGSCYCLDCGSDLSADHRNTSLDRLLTYADRIAEYVNSETPLTVDGDRYEREVRRMKANSELQGYETEMLAVGFARSVTQRAPESESSSPPMLAD